jgi:hypothetical protein
MSMSLIAGCAASQSLTSGSMSREKSAGLPSQDCFPKKILDFMRFVP